MSKQGRESVVKSIAAQIFAVNHQITAAMRIWGLKYQPGDTLDIQSFPEEILELMREVDALMITIGETPRYAALLNKQLRK